ncbi:MAG: hypothetical protein J6V98_02050, partial [Bacteroidales bacterium]|nr:hypothetical protein [Bacteroidales bacterium]
MDLFLTGISMPDGRFPACPAAVVKNILQRNRRICSDFACVGQIFLKKYFGSLEKGCTFAAVFRQRKTELFETDEKKEIACVDPSIEDRGVDTK